MDKSKVARFLLAHDVVNSKYLLVVFETQS